MDATRKQKIGDAFSAAVATYDDYAQVQRVAARTVADLAAQRPRPARILEIGCGTGLLTREISVRWPDAELVATDLSPAMVARARQDAMIAGVFLPMDGEAPWFDGAHFDLILSSLTFQWFDDLGGAVERLHELLRPGGSLIFSTMAQRSFAQWRAAHAVCGVTAGVPDHPALEDVRSKLVQFADGFAFDEDYALECGSARGLLAHLKGIGASVPVAGRVPLAAGVMRRVMAAFEQGGARDSYHVVFARVTRV